MSFEESPGFSRGRWFKIMRFKKILKEIKEMLTGRCRFDDECEHYREDSVICDSEAGSYCGKYRSLINEEK